MVAGIVYGCLYIGFAVAMVALSTGVTRSTIGAIGLSLVALVLLPLVGVVPLFQPWTPTLLVGAMDELVRGAPVDEYIRAAGVAVALSAAALWAAARLTARREL
jgi:hypothetical protein